MQYDACADLRNASLRNQLERRFPWSCLFPCVFPKCRRHYSTTKRPAAHWPSPLFSGAIWGETYMSSRSRTAAPKPSQSHFASISSKRRRCGAWWNRIPIQGTEEYHSPYRPSNRRNGTIAEKYPSAATTGDKEPK